MIFIKSIFLIFLTWRTHNGFAMKNHSILGWQQYDVITLKKLTIGHIFVRKFSHRTVSQSWKKMSLLYNVGKAINFGSPRIWPKCKIHPRVFQKRKQDTKNICVTSFSTESFSVASVRSLMAVPTTSLTVLEIKHRRKGTWKFNHKEQIIQKTNSEN